MLAYVGGYQALHDTPYDKSHGETNVCTVAKFICYSTVLHKEKGHYSLWSMQFHIGEVRIIIQPLRHLTPYYYA